MPKLHETLYGKRLLEHDIPAISQHLRSIANALQEQNEIAVRTNEIMIEANELKKKELEAMASVEQPGDFNILTEE